MPSHCYIASQLLYIHIHRPRAATCAPIHAVTPTTHPTDSYCCTYHYICYLPSYIRTTMHTTYRPHTATCATMHRVTPTTYPTNYISNQLHIQRLHTAIRTTIYAICRPIYVPLYISGTIYTYHYIYIAIRTTIYAVYRPTYVPLYILYTYHYIYYIRTTMYHYICYLPSPYCYIYGAPTHCRPSCAYCCMYI